MRVVIFIDGKNFFAGWKDATGGADLDFRKLSLWVVRAVGGTHLSGAYYYTGVDETIPRSPAQEKLEGFLNMLELQPGFFVQRFAQKMRSQTCPSCGNTARFSHEKEVDTTIVADMLRLAAVGAFDVAVLISGDADLVPAVEGVRALGKKVYVGSWGASGLSARIRKAAFDQLNLLSGLPEFGREPGSGWQPHEATGAPTFAPVASGAATPTQRAGFAPSAPVAPLSQDPEVHCQAFMDELQRATVAMPGGYIGAHFFVTRWRSHTLVENPEFRRRVLDRLVEQGKAEIYLTEDGIQAVRMRGVGPAGQ